MEEFYEFIKSGVKHEEGKNGTYQHHCPPRMVDFISTLDELPPAPKNNQFIRQNDETNSVSVGSSMYLTASAIPDFLLTASSRGNRIKTGIKEGQRNEELIHIFRLAIFVTIENFFSDSWVLMSERKSPNKLHHISCQSYLDKSRGSFDPVNLDKYLPLLPTDEEKPFLSECCQGIVNFELLISHLGSISHMGKAQPGCDEEGNSLTASEMVTPMWSTVNRC